MALPIFPITGLDDVIAAYAAGNRVNFPALAYFDFRDGPMPVWGGEYDLTAGGVTWKGLGVAGRLISVTGIEEAATLEAAQMVFTLSGTDQALMAIAAGEDRGDYVNRMVGVYGVFCDADWQPLSSPMALRAGIMGTLSITKHLVDGGEGKDPYYERQIRLPADNIFYGRGTPPASYYTDADQQRRFPGDKGLQFIAGLQDDAINVPWH